MPTLEWFKIWRSRIGLRASRIFVLSCQACFETYVTLRHLALIIVCIVFSLPLASVGFYAEYLAKHERTFAKLYANALLTESRLNMKQDVIHCQAFLQKTAMFLQAEMIHMLRSIWTLELSIRDVLKNQQCSANSA
jgi:hypothetical protein